MSTHRLNAFGAGPPAGWIESRLVLVPSTNEWEVLRASRDTDQPSDAGIQNYD
jgi:hypothetical protein